MDMNPNHNSQMRFEDLLRSPQFKRALFEVQKQECERWLALGGSGFRGGCDYILCYTNYNGLCGKCFAENAGCPKNLLDFPPGICYT